MIPFPIIPGAIPKQKVTLRMLNLCPITQGFIIDSPKLPATPRTKIAR